MIRFFDFVLSLIGMIILAPLGLVLYVLCLLDTGSPIYAQKRLGKHKRLFTLYKFRTMRAKTASIPTYMIEESCVTKLGRFLRKTKLDELPQFFNVLRGEMSMVGPRPIIPEETDAVKARDKYDIYDFLPGITGLAQISNIGTNTPEKLAFIDDRMLKTFSSKDYFNYFFATISGKGYGDLVREDSERKINGAKSGKIRELGKVGTQEMEASVLENRKKIDA